MLVTGDAKWKDYRISTQSSSPLIPTAPSRGAGSTPTAWSFGTRIRRTFIGFPSPAVQFALQMARQTAWPRQGVSIQKVVNGEWSEVFWEKGAAFSSKKFVPSGQADQSTFDLSLTVSGNQVEFTIVSDPNGAAKVFNYGPIEITGVDSGKVGFFSFSQRLLDIHHIKVEEISGIPFETFSDFGKPSPAVGPEQL